jgi:hypothetical protein
LQLYRKLIEVNDAKVKELRDKIERNRNFMAKRKGALKSPEPSPSRSRARDMIERETNRLLASAVEEQKQSIANTKAAYQDTQSRILNIAQQGIAKLEDDNLMQPQGPDPPPIKSSRPCVMLPMMHPPQTNPERRKSEALQVLLCSADLQPPHPPTQRHNNIPAMTLPMQMWLVHLQTTQLP